MGKITVTKIQSQKLKQGKLIMLLHVQLQY